ncbi:hypothetical protein PR048_032877 [Dryococelus australis]|uniref:Uncharacterized protein n=1 Tax=Dryococelus australis TaxID=614101 RepID=A0ABQ9G3G8_9NEOP|nr:hypothetical protein PR048_032877 [Dryococelus australis]
MWINTKSLILTPPQPMIFLWQRNCSTINDTTVNSALLETVTTQASLQPSIVALSTVHNSNMELTVPTTQPEIVTSSENVIQSSENHSKRESEKLIPPFHRSSKDVRQQNKTTASSFNTESSCIL